MTGSNFSGYGGGIVLMFYVLVAALVIFMPLGLWKLTELAIWL